MPQNALVATILACGILGFALWLGFISWTQTSSAYLFPRLITAVFVLLSGFLLGRTLWQSETLPPLALRKLAIALGVLGFYVFVGAKLIGFYASSYIIFVLLLSFYDNKSHRNARSWFWRGAIGMAFMAVIYALFGLLLRVQTPVGWFM